MRPVLATFLFGSALLGTFFAGRALTEPLVLQDAALPVIATEDEEIGGLPDGRSFIFEDGGKFETWFPTTNPRVQDASLTVDEAGHPEESVPLPSLAVDLQFTVRRGDTFKAVLNRAGIPGAEAERAIRALSKVYNPRQLRPGLELFLQTQPPKDNNDTASLISIDFIADPEKDVSLLNDGDGQFTATVHNRTLTPQLTYGRGIINSSLYAAGKRAGVPPVILASLISLYSFDVDFQRDIRPGDAFEIAYEKLTDEAGTPVRTGDVVVASMTLSGQTMTLYRFKTDSGFTDFFHDDGQSAQKSLLRTPTDAARISSGYGRRRHPVLGYTRIHQGVDFAAPVGTPVYAAGDGLVEKAGWAGAYGRYIRIRHNVTYKSAYAHLYRIAEGITPGTRVKQRQIIGYIGASGRVTGSHLHYEVLRNNRQVNPQTVRLPAGNRLKGEELKRFTDSLLPIKENLTALRRRHDAQSIMISGDGTCDKSTDRCR